MAMMCKTGKGSLVIRGQINNNDLHAEIRDAVVLSGVTSVNGKTNTVILTADDVEAISYSKQQNLTSEQQLLARTNIGAIDKGYADSISSNLQTQIDNKVPTTRKVNNKALSGDITLTASDVNALPSSTTYVKSINGQTGDATLTANDVGAIDEYNGMTPVECVYTHFGSQQTKIIYVEEGTLIPPSSSASDDIKNAWKRLLAIPLSGLAATGPNSSFKDLIRGIGLLADNGVFGDLLSQSGNEFICYTDVLKQNVCLHIYNSKTADKTITVYFNFYKQDKYQQVTYCISNDTFNDYCSFEEPVKKYSSNINVTALTMPQTEMAAAPTKDMHIATKKYVDDAMPIIATDDDAMDFLAEMGMITPVTDANGEILISSSNEIYSL